MSRHPGTPQRPRTRRGPRPIRVLAWASTILASLTLAGTVSAYATVDYLDRGITRTDVFSNVDAASRPQPAVIPAATGPSTPVNLLVLGSDTRDGADEQYQGTGREKVEGARADTTLFVRLSAARDRAWVVSVPRDSYVTIPACTSPTGHTLPEHRGMFNSAFTDGGTACTVATFERLSGMRLDHTVVVDFAGFKDMVAALHGVPVCLTEPLKDTKDIIDLPAGRHVLQGDQALGFVRARYGIGDGTDIGRIERQKQFMSAMVNRATSSSTLLRPDRVVSFLHAVTGSLIVDSGFTSAQMQNLVISMRDLRPSGVSFQTLPLDTTPGRAYEPGGALYGRVKVDDDAALRLFSALSVDQDPQPAPTDLGVTPSDASASPQATPTTPTTEMPATATPRPSASAAARTAASYTC